MAFLVPLFLAGLAALAVPLLVHLRHRERKEPVRFPSLMFLRRVPFREVSRQQIHHWPLFLIRCLVVALLVVAFARPFLRDRAGIAAPTAPQGREVVILLDRSASMGYGDRWARARDRVAETIAGLSGSDRASLILFDAAPVVAAASTADRALLRAALAQAEPSTRPTRFAPALRAARDLLLASERPALEVVVVSDFQRTGWRGEVIEPLPEGTVLTRIDLSSPEALNLSLVDGDAVVGATGVVVSVQVRPTGPERTARVRADLVLDGREAGSRDVALDGRSAVAVRFPPAAPGQGLVRGVVRLSSGDSLAADDRFHLVIRPERPIRVFVRRTGTASRVFLDRALGLSRRPRVTVTVREATLSAADLRVADVLVLDDLPFPDGVEAARIVEAVRRGIGLIHLLGPRTSGRWPAELGALGIGQMVERTEATGGTVGQLRREHPIFEPFRAPGSGDFSTARVYRYRRVTADSFDVLARYDDGAPVLLEAPLVSGREGRALALTTSADNVWNDLPLQPVFLPLMHQLVLYASKFSEPEPWHTVGDVVVVGGSDGGGQGRAGAVVVVAPSGERTRHETGPAGVSVELNETGFWEIRESGPGGRALEVLAANPSPEESELAPFDPDDLVVAAGARDSARPAAALPDPSMTAVERERAQSLWWFVLAGVAVLVALELFYANRLTGYLRSSPVAEEAK